MLSLPPDLQDVLSQIEQSDHAADTLTASLSDAQFHWQPSEGRAWSIGLCLEHLGTANRVYGAALRTAVDEARARGWRRTNPVASSFFGRQFVKSLEPPVKWRLKAPSKIQPASCRDRVAIMRLYRDAHAFVRETILAAADIDVNRATFRNPFISFVRVRVGTGLHVIAAHDRRHLWQAEQVLKVPGFPAS